jgi:LL-diaminopimelate aminotransferase
MYRRRRDIMVEGLGCLGWKVPTPRAALYLWFPVPDGSPSMEFSTRVMESAGVVITPGVGFGPSSEGFMRIALTSPEDRLREAVARIAEMP